MDKALILEKIEKLENEISKFKEQLNMPDESLLHKRKEDGAYFSISERVFNHDKFQTRELRDSYIKAIDIFLELRQQPGSEPIKETSQFTLFYYIEDNSIAIPELQSASIKIARGLFPCFSTKEAATNAIAAVGRNRIIEMCKIFGHINEK